MKAMRAAMHSGRSAPVPSAFTGQDTNTNAPREGQGIHGQSD
jgi:hypothetical protein